MRDSDFCTLNHILNAQETVHVKKLHGKFFHKEDN